MVPPGTAAIVDMDMATSAGVNTDAAVVDLRKPPVDSPFVANPEIHCTAGRMQGAASRAADTCVLAESGNDLNWAEFAPDLA